jgi:ZIP family zinc transporter
MSELEAPRDGAQGETLVGVGSVVALVALSAYAATVASVGKVLVIGWVAFAAMAVGALVGARAGTEHPRGLVWGYGLAAGAMVTSAAVFLVPQATNADPHYGGFGVAAGLLTGFAGHTVGHRLTHLDLPLERTVAELSAHALSAGAIIGVVYAAMPDLGALLGLAIVSHKGPAGYAAARRLQRSGRSVGPLLLPASGVGLTALPATLLGVPVTPTVQAVVFGFAAGIFLHVAMDFLPRCETGSEVHDHVLGAGHDDHAHALLDRLRVQAVVSTALGALAVFAAWAAI